MVIRHVLMPKSRFMIAIAVILLSHLVLLSLLGWQTSIIS